MFWSARKLETATVRRDSGRQVMVMVVLVHGQRKMMSRRWHSHCAGAAQQCQNLCFPGLREVDRDGSSLAHLLSRRRVKAGHLPWPKHTHASTLQDLPGFFLNYNLNLDQSSISVYV